MSAGKLDLYIEQGATFKSQLIWKDATDTEIDLSGYTARLQVRPKALSDVLYIDLTTENGGITLGGVAGTIDMQIAAADTEAITWLKAKYDLELIDGTGFVTRLVEGEVKVSFNVTKPIVVAALDSYLNQSYWAGVGINWDGTKWIKNNGLTSELVEQNDWNIGFRPSSIIIDYTITVEVGAGIVFDLQTLAGDSLGSATVNNAPGTYQEEIPLTFNDVDLHKLIIGSVGYTDDLTIDNITFALN
jgi:hypothetical protein